MKKGCQIAEVLGLGHRGAANIKHPTTAIFYKSWVWQLFHVPVLILTEKRITAAAAVVVIVLVASTVRMSPRETFKPLDLG